VQHTPGYPLVVLKLVQAGVQAAGGARADPCSQAAAVLFKNYVKKNWDPNEAEKENGVAAADRAAVKQHLLSLMCTMPPRVQKQLGEAVRIIGQHDFPARWQSLLPEIVAKIAAAGQNYAVVNGLLEVANSIFKRFRNVYKSDALYAQLKPVTVSDIFPTPHATISPRARFPDSSSPH